MDGEIPITFDTGLSQQLSEPTTEIVPADLNNVLTSDLLYAGISPSQVGIPMLSNSNQFFGGQGSSLTPNNSTIVESWFPVNTGYPMNQSGNAHFGYPNTSTQTNYNGQSLLYSFDNRNIQATHYNPVTVPYSNTSANFIPTQLYANACSYNYVTSAPVNGGYRYLTPPSRYSSAVWNFQTTQIHGQTISVPMQPIATPVSNYAAIVPMLSPASSAVQIGTTLTSPLVSSGITERKPIQKQGYKRKLTRNTISISSSTLSQTIASVIDTSKRRIPVTAISSDSKDCSAVAARTMEPIVTNKLKKPVIPVVESRFVDVDDDDVNHMVLKAQCSNTIKSTNWSINTFKAFSEQRRTANGEVIPPAENLSRQLVIKYMKLFITGVRNQKGQNYNLHSLASLVAGIQRFFRTHGHPEVDFLKYGPLNEVRKVINAKMKELGRLGCGTVIEQPDPITQEHINLLWEKGILGVIDARAMLRTVFFYVAYWFVTRNGNSQLELDVAQFIFHSDDSDNLISFSPRSTKNHQFSLEQIGRNQDVITHHSPKRSQPCVVSILKQYFEIIGVKSGRLYYHPKFPVQSGKLEFNTNCPVGANKLSTMVRDMFSDAGNNGRFTNTSIRYATISKMAFDIKMDPGVKDKLIRGRSGHKSDSLFRYVRPSRETKRNVSLLLNPQLPNKDKTVESDAVNNASSMPTCSKYLETMNMQDNATITETPRNTSQNSDTKQVPSLMKDVSQPTNDVETITVTASTEMLAKILGSAHYKDCSLQYHFNTK